MQPSSPGPAVSSPRRAAIAIAEQGAFYVGGEYLKSDNGQVMVGQMFVQYQIPAERTQPYPVVMIHGGGQTGANFLATPDGRPGWADDFLAAGYAVYVVDQPARARSVGSAGLLGTILRRSAETIAGRFTAPAREGLYPTAYAHTQWPGGGLPGDPVFDQFYASQVEQLDDPGIGERMIRTAGAALLDRIGPALLLTHSQSGPLGWTIADARPKLVKGILAIEPNGPPVREIDYVGPPAWFADGALGRPWGITRGPLAYSPPAATADDMTFTVQEKADAPGLVCCRLQTAPARQLVNLKGIAVLIVTSEASYHAPYDHCTSQYLAQAGVTNSFVRLPDVGIRGNGHMMMLEKNSHEIAAWLMQWIAQHIR